MQSRANLIIVCELKGYNEVIVLEVISVASWRSPWLKLASSLLPCLWHSTQPWPWRLFLVLSLLSSNVTRGQQGTGADTSSASRLLTIQPVRSWSNQSPASSTAPASPTSTESQVWPSAYWGWTWRRVCAGWVFSHKSADSLQWHLETLLSSVCFRLEHMSAEWKCHLWSGFTLASPRLYSQRWQNCGVRRVHAGKTFISV